MMGTQRIPQQVLSSALEHAVNGRRVLAAVFLSYQFDPEFFELEILPLLFDRGFSEQQKVRTVQVEEALREAGAVAVYYDRRGLIDERGSSRLDYQRVALMPRRGVFHAKNVLLLVQSHDHEKDQPSLILVTTSANLTRSGWWENVEVAHVLELNAGRVGTIVYDLLDDPQGQPGLLRTLRDLDRTGEQHEALDRIETWLRAQARRGAKARDDVRLYVGRETLPAFLSQVAGDVTACRLDIIAPFVEDTEDARTTRALVERLKPRETRFYLPPSEDGGAACSEGFFDAVASLPEVGWGRLPGALTRWSAKDDDSARRFLHAKVYRLTCGDTRREMVLCGSPNQTRAAHAGARAGNIETAIWVPQAEDPYTESWLHPLGEERPATFIPQRAPEDQEGLAAPYAVDLRFNWADNVLTVHWGGEAPAPGSVVTVRGAGVSLFEVKPVILDRWVTLPEQAAAAMRKRLLSSSFVDVIVDGDEAGRVLVRETGMAYRPSLLEQLTAAEILEYWSLLSKEQQDAFLEHRLARFVEQEQSGTSAGRTKPPEVAGETMFDRFAGIFHAFSCLDEKIRDSMAAGREKDVRYLLLGNKHDSLPHLVEEVLRDDTMDPVNRYVTLLSAKQLVERWHCATPDWFNASDQLRLTEVASSLGDIAAVRDALNLEGVKDATAFFQWYEGFFLADTPARGTNGVDR